MTSYQSNNHLSFKTAHQTLAGATTEKSFFTCVEPDETKNTPNVDEVPRLQRSLSK